MRRFVVAASFLCCTSALLAQQPTLGARLTARGASADLALAVEQVASAAQVDGLPVEPLVDKAFEGLAKGYAPDRIIPVVRALATRLRSGKDAVAAAGLVRPPAVLIVAGAEAMGRGITRAQLLEILRDAPAPQAAAVGITVAASLVAQGIGPDEATQAVARAYRDGHSAEDLFELPSITSSWIAEGVDLPEVGRWAREGRGMRFQQGRHSDGGALPGATPAVGPRINPPGKKPKHP